MNVSDFDYQLPPELIAQKPTDRRDASRLMVLDRSDDSITHDHFYHLTRYLQAGDCLVLNNSRVIPARLFGVKEGTGAKVEFLLVRRADEEGAHAGNGSVENGTAGVEDVKTSVPPGDASAGKIEPERHFASGSAENGKASAHSGGSGAADVVTSAHSGGSGAAGGVTSAHSGGSGAAGGVTSAHSGGSGAAGGRSSVSAGGAGAADGVTGAHSDGSGAAGGRSSVSAGGAGASDDASGVGLHSEVWETMVRPGRRLKPGDRVRFADDVIAEIIDYGADGTRLVRFFYRGVFMERLEEIGAMPLPPYIERPAEREDRERYQTVYSKIDGSAAAPTAGLHFTEDLLREVEQMGVRLAYVTLHVGIGTFRPVKVERVEDHQMHYEAYTVPEQAARLINETKANGGRIISVGTTSTRTVESAAEKDGRGGWRVRPGSASTGIFIYPGYEFRIVDQLITNFHLPKSTLLMLVSALYDREHILAAYQEAIRERYRFFSYGDAMLIR
jgi:S-adenosylmethionine:tRNA ribosyltransferase-isomerase